MTRYILTIAGDGNRWQNYMGVRKHLVPIDGEPNLLRTIRLIRENDSFAEIYVGVNYNFPLDEKALREIDLTYDGLAFKCDTEADRYFSSFSHWNDKGRTVLIWGDVFFTEEAIKILCLPQSNWLRYGRAGKCNYSDRKWWGEEFALSFQPKHHIEMLYAMTRVVAITHKFGMQLFGTIYLAMLGKTDEEIMMESKSGKKNNFGHMIDINDFTDDFDFPEDFDEFLIAWANRHDYRRIS